MVRKTKKKKVISDYRKRIQALRAQKNGAKKKVVLSTANKPTLSYGALEKAELNKQAHAIKNDLKKTVILSTAGIGLLIGLYFTLPMVK